MTTSSFKKNMQEISFANYIQRIYYNQGLFLTAELCITEEQYFRDMLICFNSALFESSGIFYGINITTTQNTTTVQFTKGGLAVNNAGKFIIWSSVIPLAYPIPSNILSGKLNDITNIYLSQEVLTPGQNSSTGQITNNSTSNLIYEVPTLNFTKDGDANLLLGTCTSNGNNTVNIAANPNPVRPKIRPELLIQQPSNTDVTSSNLSGTAIISNTEQATNQLIKQDISYLENNNEAFSVPPNINTTICTNGEAVFASTVSNITTRGFTITLVQVAPNNQIDSNLSISVNWLAYLSGKA